MALARRPTERRRRFVTELGLGFALAYLAGALFARWVKHSAGWVNGTPWDLGILRQVHAPVPHWLDILLLTVPWFGTNITILGILIPFGIRMWRRRRRDLVVALGVVSVGSYLLDLSLKFALDRPRPSLWEHRGEYTWASFPSGHAIVMMSVLPIVAWLIHGERGWRWPYHVWIALLAATVYSRVYLGVHWPTDVAAGLVVGTIWGTAVWIALRHSEDVAQPPTTPRIQP